MESSTRGGSKRRDPFAWTTKGVCPISYKNNKKMYLETNYFHARLLLGITETEILGHYSFSEKIQCYIIVVDCHLRDTLKYNT